MPTQIAKLPEDGRGAPEGPRLPRRGDLLRHVESVRKNLAQTIGFCIQIERNRRSLTQGEVADATGISPSRISRIERGDQNVSDAERSAVARAVGARYLLDRCAG